MCYMYAVVVIKSSFSSGQVAVFSCISEHKSAPDKSQASFVRCEFMSPCVPQACDISGFFPISGFFFTNLPLPQDVLERREVATKEIKR